MLASVQEVKQDTGIKHTDLGFQDEQSFDAWLEQRIDEVTAHIQELTNRQNEDPVQMPMGLHFVARQAMYNVMMLAITARQSPVIRIDDWSVRIARADVFTSEIKNTLKTYERGDRVRMQVLSKTKFDELDEL